MKLLNIFLKTAAAVISPYVFIEKGVEHVKENVKDGAQEWLAKFIKYLIILFLFTLFILFLSLFLAQWINSFYPNRFVGYAILSGAYLVLWLVVLIADKIPSVSKRMENRIKKSIDNEI